MHHNVYVEAEQHKKAEPPLSPSTSFLPWPNWPVRQQSSQAADYDSDPKAAAACSGLLLPACCSLCSKKVQYTRSLCDISEQTVGGLGRSGGMCIVHTLHIIVKAAVAAGIAARNHLN